MSKRHLTIKYPWYWEIALVIIVCWALWGLTVLFLGDVNQESPQVGTAIGTQNVYASGLSDEAKELVEDLSYKHYGHGTAINCIEITQEEMDRWEVQHQWLSIWFEDGKFFVETQDGTWFIEMERKEETE